MYLYSRSVWYLEFHRICCFLLADAELLSISACNILSIQWPSGSAYFVIDYYHVVWHVPVVGKEASTLLHLLQELKGATHDHVHIIGHSLGAHIAGFVGKNVRVPIARITGMSPLVK